jgi:hypothetical protein
VPGSGSGGSGPQSGQLCWHDAAMLLVALASLRHAPPALLAAVQARAEAAATADPAGLGAAAGLQPQHWERLARAFRSVRHPAAPWFAANAEAALGDGDAPVRGTRAVAAGDAPAPAPAVPAALNAIAASYPGNGHASSGGGDGEVPDPPAQSNGADRRAGRRARSPARPSSDAHAPATPAPAAAARATAGVHQASARG